MQRLRLKHPVAIRWFHWINFPLLFLMIWSGLLIYWAYDVYHIGPFHFFPKWVYSILGMDRMLADGMALHFFMMWLFVLNGVLYIAYTVFSGEWRYLVPRSPRTFKDAWQVVLYDLGFKTNLPLQEKYNAAQQVSYTAVVLMGIASVLSGLAIYKPAQLPWLTAVFGGYEGARLVHFVLTMGYLVFFLVHVAQVIRAGWSNFRSIVIGFEPVEDHD
ncbi:MAG: cytochrome b/b6 domain-containing protein [Acidobacteriaceae bacterium]|nr:cytochrome b/b6 domain-containing protein [Acidobacteriaceae bacterium]